MTVCFSAKRKSENGGSEAEFIVPTVYYETEDSYYIDEESVSKGDLIYGKEDANTYAVGTDMGTLKGVYNINKGFAVFKIINILYENKNYSIVEEKTKYGITLYDHIALEGDKVKENQFTTRT